MSDINEQNSNMHEDHRRIYEELKRHQIFERKASGKPKAIILCGQPGSGRSSQIPTIMQEFSWSGAVLLEESEMQNQPQSLFEEALHGRMNLVIKATLPNYEMLKKLREEGYSTSICIVLTRERESLLRQYQKYEGQLATRGIGDNPKITEHDKI